jgi:hypothetical protein
MLLSLSEGQTSSSGLVTSGGGGYEMMEAAWRPSAQMGERPDWMEPWMEPFAQTIDVDLKLVGRVEFGSGRWRCGMSPEGRHRG